MSEHLQSFLGTGWSFPPAFDRISHAVQLSSDVADIEESIRIILGTSPGERIMQAPFGCGINRLVFEGLTTTFLTRLDNEVRTALLNFEPRINFQGIKILEHHADDGLLRLQISYTIIITNSRHNLVYPFYLVEGTNAGF